MNTTERIHVVINHRGYERPAGESILDALRAAGVQLPAMCHDDRIAPSGACRLCLVRIAGSAKAVTACATRIHDGMEIETDLPALEDARQSFVEMLARRLPADAVARFPDKPFHREMRARGITASTTTPPPGARQDRSHPYITVDMARCIDCYRCVRICAELQGQFVWHLRGRGEDTQIRPDGPTLLDSSCVACGACADTCPTGAIEDRSIALLGEPSAWTRTTCAYCGVGCELHVGTRDGRLIAMRPVLEAPVNKGHLCVKGRYAFDYVTAPDRVTEPMLRVDGVWTPVTWPDAIGFVARRLRELIDRYGPDSLGVLGSARATNEENYLAQKFARAVIGTHNVDCCARVCHAPSAAALKNAFGAGLATSSFDDIEAAGTILVCGANATENHPVVGARIKQAALRGAPLIVIDPRRIELAEYAHVHLAPRPGTTIPVLNAIAHTIVTEHLCDRTFLANRVTGFGAFARRIGEWTPERAAQLSGVDADAIRRAARLYARPTPSLSVYGLGLTEHTQGTDGVTALITLALLTGNVGKPGAGVNPLRGQNNVQGSAHMGCDPGILTGSTPIDQGRNRFERQWAVRLPTARGLNMLEMLDGATEGRVKGLWTVGYDVLLTNPDSARTAQALRALDLLIVEDLFLTETAREYATVFLPACSAFEKDGTFMNAERRIQRVRRAIPPVGGSKPDWEIFCNVARAMGAPGFSFEHPSQIWDEVRGLCDGARGMTYQRLDSAGLQWPCPAEDHPGTLTLHADRFAGGPRAALQVVGYRPTPETVSDAYPFLLNTGRSLYQFNAGTMTRRTPNNALRPADLLDVSPLDAAELGVHDGDAIRVTSRYGSAVLPARVNAGIARGQLFATFQTPGVFLNALTSPHRDSIVGTPEYKVTAVRLERTA